MLSVFSCSLSKRIFLLVTLLAVAVCSSLLPEGSIEGSKSEDTDVSDPTRALEKKDRTHIDPQATSSSVASAQENGKVKLEVKISSLSNTFSKSDPVNVTFSIANVGEITASILKWFIPSSFINAKVLQGNLFSVNYATNSIEQLDSGRVPPGYYVGPLIKRASSTFKDFLVLNPKQTHTVTIDLADYYSFSSGGLYTVVYDVMEDHLLYSTGSEGVVTRLTSNTLYLNVAGRFKPSYSVNSAVTMAATNSFNGCSTTQQSLIITARQDAVTCSNYLNDVYMSTFDPLNTNARYTEWFGPDTLNLNVGTVKTRTMSLRSAFLSADMEFDCTCTNEGVYAYVYPNQPYKIYLCGAFWRAPAVGTDSKMGTLYHETSHFDIVAHTDDVVYGQSGCRDLAISNPDKAVTNADSHEYFCESNILADPRAPAHPVVKPVTKPVPKPTKPSPNKPAPKPSPSKPAPVKPAPKKPAPKPVKPTPKPVKKPSRRPSAAPTKSPTASPTTASPSEAPSEAPSSVPSAGPTQAQPPIGMQCLKISCGLLEENVYYEGTNIDIIPFKDLQGCCDVCTITPGCVAYSWKIDGTCYLKGDTWAVGSEGFHSAVLGYSFCTKIENDVHYWGNDVGKIVNFQKSQTVEDCCVACRLFKGCKYFTFNPWKECWLKSSDSGSSSDKDYVSGSVIFDIIPYY